MVKDMFNTYNNSNCTDKKRNYWGKSVFTISLFQGRK